MALWKLAGDAGERGDIQDTVVALYVMLALAASVVCAVIAAGRARRKGRRAPLWAAMGFLIGVFALAALAIMPSLANEKQGN